VSAAELDITDDRHPGGPDRLAAELADLVTVILGHARLLDAALPDTSPGRGDVEAIVTAADRAAAVVSRLMAAMVKEGTAGRHRAIGAATSPPR